jgi:curli biogenesis system outer membrane secretion channel CsgG
MPSHWTHLLPAAIGLLISTQPLLGQDELERCDAPIGTLAVIEPDDEILRSLNSYGLGSPTALIRMMVQQSGCFRVVERGVGMTAMQRERELARQGDLQQAANVGAGQMVAADYLLTAYVQFSDDDAGGVGGAVGALARRQRRLAGVGGLIAGLKFKEAQTSMLIGDTRTGIQVAAAEGHARRTDFRLAAIGWSGPAVGAIGGYTNTNEGKVVAASFLDNYNALVRAVRSDPSLVMEPSRVQIAALVADAAGVELTINVGSAAGVILGESYDVLRPGREIRDPQTGRLIRRSTTPVGTLRITEVGDGWAVGILTGGPAQVGDCVDTCPLDEP